MKRKRLGYLVGTFLSLFVGFNFLGGGVYAGEDDNNGNGGNTTNTDTTSNGCEGIKLNTDFPIIGNCIEIKKGGKTDPTNAFPKMMGALSQIVVSLVLVVCFILVIVAGIKWASDDPKGGKELLQKVAITVVLLGLAGVILKAINPVFFS